MTNKTSFLTTINSAIGILLATALLIATPVAAQERILSIEVLVNDTPITTWDIEKRLRFVIARSGGVSTEAELAQMREQVVETMISEALQIQEAKDRFEYVLSDEDMEDLFGQQAQSFGMTPQQFADTLSSFGSGKSTVINQMRAEMVWNDITSGRLGELVSVSDEEVEEVISRTFENKGKFEFRVSEIELLVANSSQEDAVKASAENLVKQLREGGNFSEIARQISSAPTATVGGDRGWVLEGDLAPEMATLLNTMSIDEVSDPIRSPGGYVILSLTDRRRILTADKLDTQLIMSQLFLPTEYLSDPEVVQKFEAAVAMADSYTCDNLDELITLSGTPFVGNVSGTFRARDLLPVTNADYSDMQVGENTGLHKMSDGWRVLFTCERRDAIVVEPEFDDVLAQLEEQKLQMMSRRWLRDLRRNAIIEKL